MTHTAIEPLTPAYYPKAIRTLTRAFQEDPVWVYLIPDPKRRADALAWVFSRWVRIIAPLGHSWTACQGGAVALWIPPERRLDAHTWAIVRTGLVWLPFHLGFRWTQRAWPVFQDIEKRRQSALGEPHWVLDTLGVDPEYQRQGLGQALVRPMLERADREGLPCHVITHNPLNVPYYEQFGFQIVSRRNAEREAFFACDFRRPAS